MSTSATPSTVKPTSLVPPFTAETAAQKVKAAENLWNTKDPERVANAYTEETVWRNRDTFLKGRQDVVKFLKEKWNRETQYTLKKRLFATDGANRIAVQFWYEYFNVEEQSWKRTYGLEHWTFAASGLMEKRQMSGNEISITEQQRWFRDGVDVESVVISDLDG